MGVDTINGVKAYHNLALCYNIGKGIAVDKVEAFKWYTRAADAGNNTTARPRSVTATSVAMELL